MCSQRSRSSRCVPTARPIRPTTAPSSPRAIVAGTGTFGATTVGTATATAVAGVATFTNLGVDLAGGGYQLSFSAPGLTAVTSAAFDMTAPVVRSLAVATQPSGAAPGVAFVTQPAVNVRRNAVLDATDNTTVVTASIVAGSGAAGAVLSGTTTATAVAGVATFTNLAINLAGTDYKLRFTATGVNSADSATFAVAAAGAVIPPSTPPASDLSFAIDSTQDVRAISRFIYGVNGWDAVRPKNLTLSRSGGNRMTAYNWETNASNAGSDYFNENDAFLGGGTTPNGAVAPSIVAARNAGAGIVVTMPTIGHVSADKTSADKEDVNVTPNYINVRFHQSLPRKSARLHADARHDRRFRLPGRVHQFPRQDVSGRVRGGDHADHDRSRQRGGPLGSTRTRACAATPRVRSTSRPATRSPTRRSSSCSVDYAERGERRESGGADPRAR